MAEQPPQTITDYVKSYWNWMKTGWAAPLKFLWTGILVTEASLLKPAALLFTAFGGFLVRELYLMSVNPYYEGHWLWDKLDGNES